VEQDPTPATTDQTDGGSASTPEPASQAVPERTGLASFEDALRAQAVPVRDDVKDGDEDTDDGAADPDKAKSAPPPGDVKADASQQGKQGRRARAAEENAQRIADLERQLAERDPEKIREQSLAEAREQLAAEQQRKEEEAAREAVSATEQADAERYERLRDAADRDLSDEDYRWREEYKATLKAFPKADAAYRALADRRIKAAEDALTAQQNAAWNGIAERFSLLQTLDGVTKETLSEKDLFVVGQHLYEAGARVREEKVRGELQPKLDKALDEVRRLKAEASQFRVNGRGGLAAARAPMTGGGRSGPSGGGRPDWKTASGSDFFAAALRQEADRAGLSSDE